MNATTADLHSARRTLDEEGFVMLPGFLDESDLGATVAALPSLYPTADEFHDDVDPARNERFRKSQFGGLLVFPFASTDLSLLCVHDTLLDLAETLLGDDDIRLYQAEAWAKYTGAVDYDQSHHRDFGNHTILVPSESPAFRQLERFVYLDDVTESLGATAVVSDRVGGALPLLPPDKTRDDHPELYEAEIRAAGPKGTVLAYTTRTLHRGTNMTEPRGARYTIHLNFRAATTDWAQRRSWTDVVGFPAWREFVALATPRQLALFGVPKPGHPYWTEHTIAGMAQRYPGRDFKEWSSEAR
jgi:hypothetical protein